MLVNKFTKYLLFLSVIFTISCSLVLLEPLIAHGNQGNVAQLGNLENIGDISTAILDRLGYDCKTVADVGIVCKKCSSDSNFTEECTAYICDAATRKCRKKEAKLPKLPNLSN